jgi:electron transport complex protein RnfE
MGLGFTVALSIISGIREFFGSGTLFDIKIYGDIITPPSIVIMAPGGFIVLGLIVAAINYLTSKRKAGDN